MNTAELLTAAGFIFLLGACGQPETDTTDGATEDGGAASTESVEEDGFTLEQMEEMTGWQQSADSLEKAAGDSPFDRIREKGLDWIPLWKENGEWVIYEECRYGSGGLYFDESGEWLEFSGGGDANSHDIEAIEQTEEGILLTWTHALTGDRITTTVSFSGEQIMIMKDDFGETRYVLNSENPPVKTISDEPCDEEDY